MDGESPKRRGRMPVGRAERHRRGPRAPQSPKHQGLIICPDTGYRAMFTGDGETWNLTQRDRVGTFEGLCTVLLDWMHASTLALGRPVKYSALYKRWGGSVWLWYGVRLSTIIDALVIQGRIIRVEDFANGHYVLWERRVWDALTPAERVGAPARGKAPFGVQKPAPVNPLDTFAQLSELTDKTPAKDS